VKNVKMLITINLKKNLNLFRPRLSTKKRYAIRTARYTAASKVILAFETPFWEREHGKVKIPKTVLETSVRKDKPLEPLF
jgi:monoamine oxidase